MEIKSVQKFVRMSPRKLRVVAGMIRGLAPQNAIEVLPHVGKRAAEPILKVVKSAVANAKVAGMKVDELTFKEVQIGEGPTLKRGRPAARGRWHPIQKKMSHIRVVLITKPQVKSSKVKVKTDDRKVKTQKKTKKNV